MESKGAEIIMKQLNDIIKRMSDILFSAIGLIVLFPLMLMISVAVKLDSKGPVLFKQQRRTKDGKIFKMYKFRSMKVGAEKMGTGLFNYKDDPRVTRVGRFLRNTSLDELPQLLNVLTGSLSLVGPRPCVTYELGDFATLNKKYKKRFQMKAGITGLAQVKGRNDISWDEKVFYDNQYIDKYKRYGVLLDIWILAATVGNVFKSKDIYEVKADENMDDADAAKLAEEEVIRLAHVQD